MEKLTALKCNASDMVQELTKLQQEIAAKQQAELQLQKQLGEVFAEIDKLKEVQNGNNQ